MDAESPGIPADTTANGSTTDRSICISAAKFLQLDTRSGSGCVQPRLSSNKGICQPSMVLDSMMPESDEETNDKSGDDHSPLGITTMVPYDFGNVRGPS